MPKNTPNSGSVCQNTAGNDVTYSSSRPFLSRSFLPHTLGQKHWETLPEREYEGRFSEGSIIKIMGWKLTPKMAGLAGLWRVRGGFIFYKNILISSARLNTFRENTPRAKIIQISQSTCEHDETVRSLRRDWRLSHGPTQHRLRFFLTSQLGQDPIYWITWEQYSPSRIRLITKLSDARLMRLDVRLIRCSQSQSNPANMPGTKKVMCGVMCSHIIHF